MAGRWTDLGRYKAKGIPGGVAIAMRIERAVTGIKSPVTSPRGLAARLRYLTNSQAGRDAMERAGITVRPETVQNWVDRVTHPQRHNREKLDSAYWDLRRRNLAREFKSRLKDEGRGTQIEIYPVDQSQVNARHRREIQIRKVKVRGLWDDLVEAWVEGDDGKLDISWDEILNGLGSDRDKYTYVSHIGFGI